MRLWDMGIRTRESALAAPTPDRADPGDRDGSGRQGADEAVTALYRAHALGLIRLAHIMLGDRPAAEDVVQEAFCGLYRRWAKLSDPDRALPYVRSSVLNGCRSVLRKTIAQRSWGPPRETGDDTAGDGAAGGAAGGGAAGSAAAGSAEAAVLAGEDAQEVMRAVRRLPRRQREALVLRFYLDLTDAEIARDMGISPGTVRSYVHRALATLARTLEGTR
jgi:RNA polymerase sigma factor (sigma-70 family)